MEQVSAQLWNIELNFARVPLVEHVQVPEDFMLVFAGVQGHDKSEDLVLLMRHVIALLGLLLAG